VYRFTSDALAVPTEIVRISHWSLKPVIMKLPGTIIGVVFAK
jgi:hypothetical protein